MGNLWVKKLSNSGVSCKILIFKTTKGDSGGQDSYRTSETIIYQFLHLKNIIVIRYKNVVEVSLKHMSGTCRRCVGHMRLSPFNFLTQRTLSECLKHENPSRDIIKLFFGTPRRNYNAEVIEF